MTNLLDFVIVKSRYHEKKVLVFDCQLTASSCALKRLESLGQERQSMDTTSNHHGGSRRVRYSWMTRKSYKVCNNTREKFYILYKLVTVFTYFILDNDRVQWLGSWFRLSTTYWTDFNVPNIFRWSGILRLVTGMSRSFKDRLNDKVRSILFGLVNQYWSVRGKRFSLGINYNPVLFL